MLIELSGTAIAWLKALHIISVIAWMAGMLYLPRLYIYHAEAEPGSDKSETFKIMERRLLRAIMNPSMIAALIFGALMLLAQDASIWKEGWLHVKLVSVVILLGLHGVFSKSRRQFAEDRNTRTASFYRIFNEAPAVLMVIIVIMVVIRPF